MHPTIKDAIGGLKAEAKRFRELAKGKRQQLSRLKDRGFGRRDFMAELDCKLRITEYVRAAQDRDAEIKSLRAQCPRRSATGNASHG